MKHCKNTVSLVSSRHNLFFQIKKMKQFSQNSIIITVHIAESTKYNGKSNLKLHNCRQKNWQQLNNYWFFDHEGYIYDLLVWPILSLEPTQRIYNTLTLEDQIQSCYLQCPLPNTLNLLMLFTMSSLVNVKSTLDIHNVLYRRI